MNAVNLLTLKVNIQERIQYHTGPSDRNLQATGLMENPARLTKKLANGMEKSIVFCTCFAYDPYMFHFQYLTGFPEHSQG